MQNGVADATWIYSFCSITDPTYMHKYIIIHMIYKRMYHFTSSLWSGWSLGSISNNRQDNQQAITTLGSHSGVSVRRASGQDSCSEEPGCLVAPELRKWRAGSAARHDHRFVAGYSQREREFAYQIPRFKQTNVFSFICWYIGNMPCVFLRTKAFKFQELQRTSLGDLSTVSFRAFLQTQRF